VGRAARKIISAGSLISEALVEVLPDIEPGQEVHVVASRGAARITFDAVARTGGRKGDSILLLNPESQRTFHGIVDGKGLAHAGPGA
jgi:flagella basal body P-ring formation protein FlgA